MKPKHIQRGLANKAQASVARNNEAVPGVGRLKRIHRTYESSRKRSRHIRDKSTNLRFVLRVLFACFAMTLIAGVSWVLYDQINRSDKKTVVSTLAQDTFVIPHPPADSCVSLVKDFLAISNANDLSRTARLKRLGLAESYSLFVKFRMAQGEVDRIEWIGAEETNGMSLERVLVIYKSGQYAVASLTDVGQGDWKVDFDSFVSYQTKPWEQIISQGSCSAVVRVKVTPDSYYTGYFQNENEWICLAMRFNDQSDIVYGYVTPNSPVFLDIVAMLRVNDPADMMVEISRDAGMNRMQYEIRGVIAQGWVESDVPFNARNIKKSPSVPTPQ